MSGFNISQGSLQVEILEEPEQTEATQEQDDKLKEEDSGDKSSCMLLIQS